MQNGGRIALILCSTLVILFLFLFVWYSESPSFAYSPESPEWNERLLYWKQYIEKNGPKDAYDHFLKLNVAQNIQVQHEYAHTFGQALYESMEIEGIHVCDYFSFSSGCYHELFRLALAEEGLNLSNRIVETCISGERSKSRVRDCYHAVGHGVGYYFGSSKLDEALEYCRSYGSDYAPACSDGVFMEHISPGFMVDITRHPNTPPEEVSSICYEHGNEFSYVCYRRFIQWWGSRLQAQMEPAEYIPLLDYFCSNLPAEKERRSCAMSIGVFVLPTWVSVNATDMIRYCSLIEDAELESECMSGTIRRIAEYPEHEDQVTLLCEHTNETNVAECNILSSE